MIKKLLVANRGEIACRVMRTCRSMGIATVVVYSDPDAAARFVREADEAVPLGGTTAAESYLRIDRIIDAARLTGADAIHPGYGFLSENADFARACAAAGIGFVGPSPEVIELMGSKLAARELMERAGVPVLPGRDLTGIPEEQLIETANTVGWPVLVKASYGGGGRGMRIVRRPAELREGVAAARREAASAFGNDTVFLEHYVDRPRHVEIQIFGDAHGNVVHLGERECSIQRRHQKIVEEAPSPAVDGTLRAAMGEAAVAAGRALGYVGAGTVEFILAPDGRFHFLEVNTRLQVEHPVTELVTGLDLVRMQLEVASGLPLRVTSLPPMVGHAVEARLYAEDPAGGFLPKAGVLAAFEIPEGDGIRLDAGVASGDAVSTNYDPMLAKIIAHGATRDEACARLARTLRAAKVVGVTTNRALLVGVLEHAEFLTRDVDTHFLDRVGVAGLIESGGPGDPAPAALAAALADQARNRQAATRLASLPSGFRNNPSQPQQRSFRSDAQELGVTYSLGRDPSFAVNGTPVDARLLAVTPAAGDAWVVDLLVGGVRRRYDVRTTDNALHVTTAAGTTELTRVPRFPAPEAHVQPGSMLAPMPGTVVRVEVGPGAVVAEGETLIVLEAMKMEHAVRAVAQGVVLDVLVRPGEAVDNGQLLIVLGDETGDERDGADPESGIVGAGAPGREEVA